MGVDVPRELEDEILSRVPEKSLARFRSVCKQWNTQLVDETFIEQHSSRMDYNYDATMTRCARGSKCTRLFTALVYYLTSIVLMMPTVLDSSANHHQPIAATKSLGFDVLVTTDIDLQGLKSTNSLIIVGRKGSCVLPRCSISTPTVFNSDNPFLSSLVDKVRQLKVKPLNAVNWTWLFLALVYRSVSRGLRHLLHQANAFEQLVRKRLYRDYYARTHDPKWDVDTRLYGLRFCLVFVSWLDIGLLLLKGLSFTRLSGGWVNVGIWGLIVVTMLMQYDSTLYLARYSEKVVVPTAVVQFGPYRWIMHPIYASTILPFATYCNALRASLSLLFLVAVCLVYYDKKAKLEEEL
ncbi:hypothetical protein F2Q68_00000822 [Brassica cretica]|uniref:F-box domain-containing protein n=1 Tax=Brassica cretica TaxID=69181 RepID=A0A8S9JCA4_BRACR|nr:hypothetical protein F2Q68_00000822 [Brassica cretica]